MAARHNHAPANSRKRNAMLRVPIEQTTQKMVLARSVANPQQPEHILLKAGYELDEHHINRLRELRVPSVWVNYPGLDFLDELLDPELVRQQQELYGTLKEQFTEAQGLGLDKIDYQQYVQKTSDLFRTLLSENSRSAMFIAELQSEADDIFAHGTVVASIALLIGLRLESYLIRARPNLPPTLAGDLTPLGVGCLLHDMGKLALPEELQKFHMTAQNHGDPAWQKHTEAGFDMLKGGLDACAGQIILNHHQHFDGSGFPARKGIGGAAEHTLPLAGEEIHIFCRIATLADRFEGFRHLPDGRTAPNVVALKRLKNPGYASWFDPAVYEAFTEAMPAFLPGDQVALNSGQTVVVTEVNEGNPCRPMVRPIDPTLAQQPDKEEAEQPPDINLISRPDLHIARVGDFDVTSYLH